jgi:hypothetical protein
MTGDVAIEEWARRSKQHLGVAKPNFMTVITAILQGRKSDGLTVIEMLSVRAEQVEVVERQVKGARWFHSAAGCGVFEAPRAIPGYSPPLTVPVSAIFGI